MVEHNKKAQLDATPLTPEKHDHFINGIPEEDEEEEADAEEEEDRNDDSIVKKGESLKIVS